MNIGLTTSFIVAGILLLSILSMNANISQSSSSLTMRQITKLRSGTLAEMLQKDISNIGSDINSRISSPILDAENHEIVFQSNIDNSGSVETISWKWTNMDATNTKNPNDRILVRSVDGNETKFKNGVTNFEIIYRDENRNKIDIGLLSSLLGGRQSQRDKIRYIEISFTMESDEQVGEAKNLHYLETIWKEQFTPINLQL